MATTSLDASSPCWFTDVNFRSQVVVQAIPVISCTLHDLKDSSEIALPANFKDRIEHYAKRVDAKLESALPPADRQPTRLHEAMRSRMNP